MKTANGIPQRLSERFPREILIVFVLVALLYSLFLPRSFFEFDETLFARAVLDYQPWQHHPPPPGYPLFIAVAKVFNLLFADPFRSLVILSLISSIAAVLILAYAFAAMTGSVRAGALGAGIFYLSPVMLIHGSLPISEPFALALLAGALLLFARAVEGEEIRTAVAFGVVAGLTVGARPQFAILVVPFVLVALGSFRQWRARAVVLGGFAAGCLVWLVPFVVILGGVDRFIEFELGQAAYYAAHDAGISRGGWTFPRIVARFLVRPWGPLWLAVPVLLLAAAGALSLLRSRLRFALPLLAAGATYFLFAVATMDPADGARYAIPAALTVAFLAGAGMLAAGRNWYGPAIAAVLAMASLGYTGLFLVERSSGASPPARASAWIRAQVPPDAVILYELPLWPHATWWLADYRIMKIDEGAPLLVNEPNTPVFIFGNGGSYDRDATIFRWSPSHAFSKVTRNHYGVITVVELPPNERYRIVRGVYDSERDPDHEWRWVAGMGEINLPDVDADRLVLRMSLSRTFPRESNAVRVSVNGVPAGVAVLERSRESVVTFPISDGEQRVRFECADPFVPAQETGGRGDPRSLCFQLLGVEQETVK